MVLQHLFLAWHVSECFWLVTNLNIAQLCFMIKNCQKWYILDQYWWLVYFSVCFVCSYSIHICFFLGSRMFIICYKSNYSSGMFYDWKFSEMVHPGSALMTGMFSHILCMFFLGSRMFVIYYKAKNTSDMFYDWNFLEMVHPASALMTGMFSCILYMFVCPKSIHICFFHIKILLKKLHFTRIFQLW